MWQVLQVVQRLQLANRCLVWNLNILSWDSPVRRGKESPSENESHHRILFRSTIIIWWLLTILVTLSHHRLLVKLLNSRTCLWNRRYDVALIGSYQLCVDKRCDFKSCDLKRTLKRQAALSRRTCNFIAIASHSLVICSDANNNIQWLSAHQSHFPMLRLDASEGSLRSRARSKLNTWID